MHRGKEKKKKKTHKNLCSSGVNYKKDLLAANTNTSLITLAPDHFFEEAYEAFKIYNGTISYNGIERIFLRNH